MIRMMRLGVLLFCCWLTGCSNIVKPIRSEVAKIGYTTQINDQLRNLPPPKNKIVLAVYKFRDQTGQYKPGTPGVSYSTAVTQGATSMLIKALEDVGNGSWFTVLERESLPDLLNERKIIRQTRQQYQGANSQDLPPLLYAPILLDGGVVAYETNLLTGGLGARYLGIGGSTEFQSDSVTIYLRAVSVKNGSVLKSVSSNKTIFSIKLDVGIFKFIDFKQLVEGEAGFTSNEPPQLAVLEALEKGVYSLVMEGARDGLWSFADPEAEHRLLGAYELEKQETLDIELPAGES